MPSFSIGQVVHATQLTERQIRYYEDKGLIKPLRSKGGHRLFSERDLDLLLRLAEQRRKGKSLSRAIAALSNRSPDEHQTQGENMAVRLFFGMSGKECRL
ncbi:MAG: MerR family transcriptional regulator [Bacillota bacterium]|nr:MerR family transcriptional regulator [Bacillota bacterium]